MRERERETDDGYSCSYQTDLSSSFNAEFLRICKLIEIETY